MQPDVIEQLCDSTIQHGKYNDRIYVMKTAPDTALSLAKTLKGLAHKRGYSKIFAKVRASQAQHFLDEGFHCEAQIPQFFRGREPVMMLGLFLDEARRESATAGRNQEVMAACLEKQSHRTEIRQHDGAALRMCSPEDAEVMAELYGRVFPTYPFPIQEPAYIRETIASHVVYFGIWIAGRLAALSSAEMDMEALSVEMTDFATLPQHRGLGLATALLQAMEAEMCSRKMVTAYTIARAPSFGMNITFSRMGYRFGGRLINNTNIGGQFEDMNVWHKCLVPCHDTGSKTFE